MNKDIDRILISKEEIAKKVKELAVQINKDFEGETISLVCILKGASIFTADLVRELKGDVTIDFIAISSYGSGTESTGEVKLSQDLAKPIAGKNVIIVEDIIDSGLTLNYLKNLLLSRNPKCIKLCTILDKPERRKIDLLVDYVGFVIPNEFIVGYGLDYAELYRNLPDVCVLAPSAYQK